MKTAIIGLGRGGPGRGGAHSIAYAHAWAMRANGLGVDAACARSAANRQAFAAEFPEARLYDEYAELLAAERPALVSVCAYPAEREAMCCEALANGARLLWVEKPLAATPEAGARILAAAADCGARVVVGHQRRYAAPVIGFLAACGSAIGRLRTIDIVQPCPNLRDFGCHLLDIALAALPAEPIRILAAAQGDPAERHHGLPVERRLLGSVHFADGARLTVETGEGMPAVPIIAAYGDGGRAELHARAAPCLHVAGADGDAWLAGDEGFHHPPTERNAYYDRLLADALACAARGAPCRVDGAAAQRGLALISALYAAAGFGGTMRPLTVISESPS